MSNNLSDITFLNEVRIEALLDVNHHSVKRYAISCKKVSSEHHSITIQDADGNVQLHFVTTLPLTALHTLSDAFHKLAEAMASTEMCGQEGTR